MNRRWSSWRKWLHWDSMMHSDRVWVDCRKELKRQRPVSICRWMIISVEISLVGCSMVSIRMLKEKRPTMKKTTLIFELIFRVTDGRLRNEKCLFGWLGLLSMFISVIEKRKWRPDRRRKLNVHPRWSEDLCWSRESHVIPFGNEIDLVDWMSLSRFLTDDLNINATSVSVLMLDDVFWRVWGWGTLGRNFSFNFDNS